MLRHLLKPGNRSGKQIMLEVVTGRQNLRPTMKITTTKTKKMTKKPDPEIFHPSSTDRTEGTVLIQMMKIITKEGRNQ